MHISISNIVYIALIMSTIFYTHLLIIFMIFILGAAPCSTVLNRHSAVHHNGQQSADYSSQWRGHICTVFRGLYRRYTHLSFIA